MKVSNADFMAFQKPGIDMFIQYVDAVVEQTGEPYKDAVKRLQKELWDYIVQRDAFQERPLEAPLPAPLTMTLGDLLKRNTCGWPAFIQVSRNVVYIIKDDDRVLYVGSTRYDARKRIKSHEKAHSPLGEALRTDANRNRWSVEMIPHPDYDSAAIKEKELITELTPAFCRRV